MKRDSQLCSQCKPPLHWFCLLWKYGDDYMICKMISNLWAQHLYVPHCRRLLCSPTFFLIPLMLQKRTVIDHKSHKAKLSRELSKQDTLHHCGQEIVLKTVSPIWWTIQMQQPRILHWLPSSSPPPALQLHRVAYPSSTWWLLPLHAFWRKTDAAQQGITYQRWSDTHPFQAEVQLHQHIHMHFMKSAAPLRCPMKKRDVSTLTMEARVSIVARNQIDDVGS